MNPYISMPYTKEVILSLVEKLKLLNNNKDITATLQPAIDYLAGQTITIPSFTVATTAQHLSVFVSLLQLPDNWNDNDRLVLQLISPPLSWAMCKNTFLSTVVPMLDAPGTSSSIVLRFSYFTSFLKQRGCTQEEIGFLVISYSGDGNNFDLTPLKFTPLRKFLQDLLKSAETDELNAYLVTWKHNGWNSLFFRLLSKNHPNREIEYLEYVLMHPRDNYHFYELSKILLQNNLSRYKGIIERVTGLLAGKYHFVATLSGYYLLAVHLPEKYNRHVVKAAYDYLNHCHTSIATRETKCDQPANQASPDIIAVTQLLALDTLPAIHYLDNYLSEKRYLHPDIFQLLGEMLQNKAVPLLLKALDNGYDANNVLPALTQLDKTFYIDQLWAFTTHKLKSVRTSVAVILCSHPMALEKAGKLLLHKKAAQRLVAVQILCTLNTAIAKQLIQQALHKEVNADVRDLMLKAAGDTIGIEDAAVVTKQVITAKKRGKLSRPQENWLEDMILPPLYLLDGSIVTTDMIRFLIYRMSRTKDKGPDVEAKPLLRLIDKSRSGNFALLLFELFTIKGSEAKYNYLLTLAALLGNDDLVDKLSTAIVYWISRNRLKMAEQGINALILQGNHKALQQVNFFIKKYPILKNTKKTLLLSSLHPLPDN